MKKKFIITVSIVLAFAILAGGAWVYVTTANPFHINDITGFAQTHPFTGEIAPLRLNADGEFVVLQFTDTHIINARGPDSRTDRQTLAMMEHWITHVNPDLVVITGDMLEGRHAQDWLFVDRQAALHGIIDVFARLNQPWTFTPGNNDHEFMGSAADIAAFLAYHCDYVLLSNEPSLPGAVNFVLELTCEDNGFVHQLIFIDSLSRHDIMQASQANWLSGQLLDRPQASIFFHYNTPMFYHAGFDGRGREGDTAIDEVILAADNVGLVSVGHFHPPENWHTNMDGTYFKVVRASGYRRGTQAPGGAIITIRPGEDERYTFNEIVF